MGLDLQFVGTVLIRRLRGSTSGASEEAKVCKDDKSGVLYQAILLLSI